MNRAAPAATAPALRLHVAQLALPAMPRAQGARVGAAMQAELARLLARPLLQQRLRAPGAADRLATAVLDGGTLRLRPGERPERTGRRLARQIAGRIAEAADGGMEAAP